MKIQLYNLNRLNTPLRPSPLCSTSLLLVRLDAHDTQLAHISVSKLISQRCPGHNRARRRSLESVNLLTTLDMKHINTHGLTLLHLDIATSHEIISIMREAHALDGTDQVRERTTANPILGVVQAHQRVGAT